MFKIINEFRLLFEIVNENQQVICLFHEFGKILPISRNRQFHKFTVRPRLAFLDDKALNETALNEVGKTLNRNMQYYLNISLIYVS